MDIEALEALLQRFLRHGKIEDYPELTQIADAYTWSETGIAARDGLVIDLQDGRTIELLLREKH